MKRGGTAGFPRFKASARYHAADFRVGDGLLAGMLEYKAAKADVELVKVDPRGNLRKPYSTHGPHRWSRTTPLRVRWPLDLRDQLNLQTKP